MSANATPQSIPIRRIQINHPSEIPSDYGTTPGGTMFSTTPGGTRIIYDRLFLLKCRDSPLSKTPPANLPDIPGVTTPDRSPAKHMIGKIAEEARENGKSEARQYQGPQYFHYPPPSCYNVNNNNFNLQVPQNIYPVRNYNSKLMQYRQRQSVINLEAYPRPPNFPPGMNAPPMDPNERGVFSPVPIPMDHPPYASPPFFIHPIRGPAGPIFDPRPIGRMSQLAKWRNSQSHMYGAQGYSTSKAPRLQSSFDGHGEIPAQMPTPDGLMSPIPHTKFNQRSASFDEVYANSSGYSSYEENSRRYSSCGDNDIFMVVPDDPSIIACKPLGKYRTDSNQNFTTASFTSARTMRA